MKQYKAIIKHTGTCEGYHYKLGKEVTLPESVIRALGREAEILEEINDVEPAKKEVKDVLNKMVGVDDVKTK